MPHAFAEGGNTLLALALDPATLWNTYGVVRLSLVYRGRAVPLGWKVLAPPSRSGAYDIYTDGRDQVAALLPVRRPVVLTADRGFADTPLMEHLARWGGHWRLRIKGRVWR
jgi:hypothetical protein